MSTLDIAHQIQRARQESRMLAVAPVYEIECTRCSARATVANDDGAEAAQWDFYEGGWRGRGHRQRCPGCSGHNGPTAIPAHMSSDCDHEEKCEDCGCCMYSTACSLTDGWCRNRDCGCSL